MHAASSLPCQRPMNTLGTPGRWVARDVLVHSSRNDHVHGVVVQVWIILRRPESPCPGIASSLRRPLCNPYICFRSALSPCLLSKVYRSNRNELISRASPWPGKSMSHCRPFQRRDVGMGPKNVALEISGACSKKQRICTPILQDYRLMSVVCCFTTH